MKNTTRTKVNLIFSSFLVIGYIICTFFFSSLAGRVAGTVGGLIQVLFLILFGLLLFYATRVGEGKQVRRFSLAVLLMVVLPCVYIIAANFIEFLPFHQLLTPVTAVGDAVSNQSVVVILASIALGYGVPYTFFAGYELAVEDETSDNTVVEGGIIEELAEAEAEQEAEDYSVTEAEAEDKAEKTAEAEREAEIEIEIQETAE